MEIAAQQHKHIKTANKIQKKKKSALYLIPVLYWRWKWGEQQWFDSVCKMARSTGWTRDRMTKKSAQKVNRKSSHMW